MEGVPLRSGDPLSFLLRQRPWVIWLVAMCNFLMIFAFALYHWFRYLQDPNYPPLQYRGFFSYATVWFGDWAIVPTAAFLLGVFYQYARLSQKAWINTGWFHFLILAVSLSIVLWILISPGKELNRGFYQAHAGQIYWYQKMKPLEWLHSGCFAFFIYLFSVFLIKGGFYLWTVKHLPVATLPFGINLGLGGIYVLVVSLIVLHGIIFFVIDVNHQLPWLSEVLKTQF